MKDFTKYEVDLELNSFSAQSNERETYHYKAILHQGEDVTYLQYVEQNESGEDITCRLKIEPTAIKLTRKGTSLTMEQQFEVGKTLQGNYRTIEGFLPIEAKATHLVNHLGDASAGSGKLELTYDLLLQGEKVDERKLCYMVHFIAATLGD